jgi:hypothetical protein
MGSDAEGGGGGALALAVAAGPLGIGIAEGRPNDCAASGRTGGRSGGAIGDRADEALPLEAAGLSCSG